MKYSIKVMKKLSTTNFLQKLDKDKENNYRDFGSRQMHIQNYMRYSQDFGCNWD